MDQFRLQACLQQSRQQLLDGTEGLRLKIQANIALALIVSQPAQLDASVVFKQRRNASQ
jgi:hypothetical protein